MSIAAIVEALFEAGATREMIVAAVRAHEGSTAIAQPVKSSAAERQKRYRDRNKASRVTGDGVTVTSDESDAETVTNVTKTVTERNAPRAHVRDITLNSETTGEDKFSLRSDESLTATVTSDGDMFGGPPPPPAKAPRPKRQPTRLPADWRPTTDDRTFALTEGLTSEETDREADQFRDYWTARGAGGAKADWPATWRNWIRKRADDKRDRAARMAGRPYANGGGRGVVGLGEIIARGRAERGDGEPFS